MRLFITIFVICSSVVRVFGDEQRTVRGEGVASAPCELIGVGQQETAGDAVRRAIDDAIDQCKSTVSQISPFETETRIDASDLWTCGLGYRYHARADFVCGINESSIDSED